MSQKQIPAPLGKLISYFAGYDSVAHFGPNEVKNSERFVIQDNDTYSAVLLTGLSKWCSQVRMTC